MNLEWKFFERQFPLAVGSLKNARSSGRLTHAFLLCSANAEYRTAFPPLLASLAACEHPNPDFSPCGRCAVCREMAEGTFPDLITLAPSSLSRIIPIGESEEEVDSMRWFESLFYLSSMTDSGWKIGIIHEADRMNEAASHPAELLPTIRSRCQTVQLTDNRCRYSFPNSETLLPVLHKLAFESKESLLAAEDCAVALIEFAEALEAEAEKNVEKKWAPRLAESENLESAGKALIEKRIKGEQSCEYRRLRDLFLSMIHAYFAQLALLTSGTPEELLPNPELFPPSFRREEAEAFGADRAFRCVAYAEDLLRAMRTNANDQLAIRSFCLKIAFK